MLDCLVDRDRDWGEWRLRHYWQWVRSNTIFVNLVETLNFPSKLNSKKNWDKNIQKGNRALLWSFITTFSGWGFIALVLYACPCGLWEIFYRFSSKFSSCSCNFFVTPMLLLVRSPTFCSSISPISNLPNVWIQGTDQRRGLAYICDKWFPIRSYAPTWINSDLRISKTNGNKYVNLGRTFMNLKIQFIFLHHSTVGCT